MKIKDGFVLRTVMGQHIIVAEGSRHKDFNKMISLNASAAILWESVEGKDFTAQDLANELIKHYGIDTQQAWADATEIAEKWKENELIDA